MIVLQNLETFPWLVEQHRGDISCPTAALLMRRMAWLEDNEGARGDLPLQLSYRRGKEIFQPGKKETRKEKEIKEPVKDEANFMEDKGPKLKIFKTLSTVAVIRSSSSIQYM